MKSEWDLPGPLPADCQVSEYVIESYLGTTSLGRMYRAKHSLLNKTVAILVLSVGLDDHRRSKFLHAVRKATVAGQPVHDMGEWRGCLYVVVGYSEDRGPLVDMSQWYEA